MPTMAIGSAAGRLRFRQPLLQQLPLGRREAGKSLCEVAHRKNGRADEVASANADLLRQNYRNLPRYLTARRTQVNMPAPRAEK